MSRYVKNIGPGKEVAYGHDHATGYFFQVFDGEDENGNDNLIIDECSMFTQLPNGGMIELMKEYKLNEDHIAQVLMDLTF